MNRVYSEKDSKNKAIYKYIVKVVCYAFNVSKEEALHKIKVNSYDNSSTCMARFIIFYLIKLHTGLSFRKMAVKLGVENFENIHYGYHKIKNIKAENTDKLLVNNIQEIDQDVTSYIGKWEKQTKNI